METEENEDDEDLSIISSINFMKLKTINFKLLPSIFKEQKHSNLRFALSLKRIHKYSNITLHGIYASIRGVY